MRNLLGQIARWPGLLWARQSLRRRITLVATALFAMAVTTGAVLLILLQRAALVHVLDDSALRGADTIAVGFKNDRYPQVIPVGTGGVTAAEVVDSRNGVIVKTQNMPGDPILTRAQLALARDGRRFELTIPGLPGEVRVLARNVGTATVLVATDIRSVNTAQNLLTQAALVGGPIAVLLVGLSTYVMVALTLRPVGALRHGAANITAAGLADERLPVPSSRDELHRLATTLNAMLDRIDSSTRRQRTFVGDAAHELRSPLASVKVQLEVAQRMGPVADWGATVDDVLMDVDRLQRLVEDLLALARHDEAGGQLRRRAPVDLRALISAVGTEYRKPTHPVTGPPDGPPVTVTGDEDALHRIVVNLVDNALRYARTGVELDLVRTTVDGRSMVEFSVTDDGPGIPESERRMVFDRFYRTEESRSRESGGTGLGLPIVAELVRSHGGTIELADRLDGNHGLRAVVRLPAG